MAACRDVSRRQFLGASALLLGRRSLGEGGAGGTILRAPFDQLRAGRRRQLYVTNASGISVYDIDNGHAFLRKIEIPDSGDYKGIAASPQLGRLYVTSHRRDELICVDLATDVVLWRKNVGPYADSHWVTPDGTRNYMPLRGEIAWVVLALSGSEKVPDGVPSEE